jgi:hypothetical protein
MWRTGTWQGLATAQAPALLGLQIESAGRPVDAVGLDVGVGQWAV